MSKAEIARSIVELMKKKDEDEVEEGYNKSMKPMKKDVEEDMEDEEDEDDKKTRKKSKSPLKSNLIL